MEPSSGQVTTYILNTFPSKENSLLTLSVIFCLPPPNFLSCHKSTTATTNVVSETPSVMRDYSFESHETRKPMAPGSTIQFGRCTAQSRSIVAPNTFRDLLNACQSESHGEKSQQLRIGNHIIEIVKSTPRRITASDLLFPLSTSTLITKNALHLSLAIV